MKDCIGLMQLPNTKTEAIFAAIRDNPISVLCQLPRPAWGCNFFTKNHVSNSMDIRHSFILRTLRHKILLSTLEEVQKGHDVYAAKARCC